MGDGNELAELYDGLGTVYAAVPAECVRWRDALKSILFGGKMTAPGAVPYGKQQNSRNSSNMRYFRSKYGDGDRIREFPSIRVAPPRPTDRQYVSSGTKIPVAPDSGRVVPIGLPDTEFEEGLRLLAEFPAEPTADRPGPGQTDIIDPTYYPGSSKARHTRFLFMSDTHLGYRNRRDGHGNTVPWLTEISPIRAFSNALTHAIELEADAVIHTGDILDHKVDSATLQKATTALTELATTGIPFYCILGSHDRGLGRRGEITPGVEWLRSEAANGRLQELTTTGTGVAGTPLQLFGVSADGIGLNELHDYGNLSWSQAELSFTAEDQAALNVLCLHDRVTPYRSSKSAPITLDRLLRDSSISFDCVLIGDEHRPQGDDPESGYRFTVDETPVLYTGPAVPISRFFETESAFVSHVTLTPDGAERKRYRTYARST